jgi:BirA family biotin operon repressor/biotin-[acetyl-CoA-carboxylase] ligase
LGRVILQTIGSTNAHALEMAASCPGPVWFLAYEQIAGRGRRARPWVSPRGNFHGTLLMHPDAAAPLAGLRSFVAALALRDALVVLCPGVDLALKWPNDVLLNGGKVAGILLESTGSGGLVRHLAVGIGVNLIACPGSEVVETRALRPVSVLQETGVRVTPERFLTALARAFDRWEATLLSNGFAPLQGAFLTHAARRGQKITARTGKDSVEGVFETIDLQGNLILSTDAGPRAISAADIFF